MVPMLTLTSILDEPSSGSKARVYLPSYPSSDRDDLILLLRGHDADIAALLHPALDRGVGKLIQLLDDFALDIGLARLTEDIGQSGHVDFGADDLGRHDEFVQQPGQITGGFGMQPLAVHDLPADCNSEWPVHGFLLIHDYPSDGRIQYNETLLNNIME